MEETSPLSPLQALEELKACYGDFVQKLEKSRATSVGEVVNHLFRSQGNPRVTYAVEEFDAALTARLTALTEGLAGCPEDDADDLAAQALELMLFYPVPADNNVAFSLAAFEGRALPLLPFLSSQRRQETASRYARRTPPRRMLPNQKKLWKELALR